MDKTKLKEKKMKRQNILLFTLLLTQTTATWAMWNDQDERAMDIIGNGQQRLSAQRTGFENRLSPVVDTLDPSMPLPRNLGTAKQRVSCTFTNGQQQNDVDVTLPTDYPLQGQWLFQEDRDNSQNRATLKLRARINNRLEDVFQREVDIRHTLRDPGIETPGQHYFDGDTAYQARTRLQEWENPRTHQRYTRTLAARDGDLHHHSGHQVIYVEPFDLARQNNVLKAQPNARPKDDYRGEYHYLRDLTDDEGLIGKKEGSLIYSDGTHIYLPKFSQELWQKGNEQAGFFISSYKQANRLNFLQQALIPNARLPQGLYQLMSSSDDTTQNRRIETWQKLGENINPITITAPLGISSIPGMGSSAPRAVVDIAQTEETITRLQRDIQRIKDRTLRRAAQHQNISDKVVVIGRAGIGKTHLIEGLAGDLVAERAGFVGPMSLRPVNPLPDFQAAGGLVGTTIPAAWVDQAHNRVIWDCPGFNGPGGDEENIRNFTSINQLFNPQTRAKILVAVPEEDLADPRLIQLQTLFNTITEVFSQNNQLLNSLSLVVTKTTVSHDNIKNALRAIRNQNPQLFNQRARNLFNSLVDDFANHPNRVTSFPVPTQLGPYQLDRDSINNCLDSTQYTLNFRTQPNLDPGAQNYITTLAQDLNQYLENYMKTEGSQRVISYCKKMIDNHQGPVNTLRTSLNTTKQTLQNLQRTPENRPLNFATNLRNMIDVTDIEKAIEGLTFLKTLKGDIVHQIPSWSNAVLQTIDALTQLTAEPEHQYNTRSQMLSLKGPIIGTSDINRLLTRYQNIAEINVFGLNTLIIDEDLTKQGIACHFLAPQWIVNGQKSININGKAGEAINSATDGALGQQGTDGRPGNPGENGGSFRGKAHTIKYVNPPQNGPALTVNTSGGQGGRGQNGGRGGNGEVGLYETYDNINAGPARATFAPQLFPTNYQLGGQPARRIGKIIIRSGWRVDSIECFGRAGISELFSLGIAGNPQGGTPHEINFDPDEVLIGSFGTGDPKKGLQCLGFITNKRRYGPYGEGGGYPFDGVKQEVTSIYGGQGYWDGVVFGLGVGPYVIKSHNFTFGNVAPLQAATNGGAGKSGGTGGKGGLGGHAGVIEGLPNDPQKIRLARDRGANGANGDGGAGGQGGAHGRLHNGPDRGRNTQDGNVGGLNPTDPTAPNALPILGTNWDNHYKGIYLQKSLDTTVSPFVKSFPNL